MQTYCKIITPVSYTHLDVYKRQALGNQIGFAFDESFPTEALYLKNFGGILIEAAEDLPACLLYTSLRPNSLLSASFCSSERILDVEIPI